MLSVPLLLKFCFDLSVIHGQVVSESAAGLWSKFLIITLMQGRLEICMREILFYIVAHTKSRRHVRSVRLRLVNVHE